jgi:acyl carrier protein
MHTNSVEDRVVELIVKQLKVKMPGASSSNFDASIDLIDGLGIDSIDMAAIALRIQDEFGIEVREEDYEGFKSVRAIAEFVRNRGEVPQAVGA